MLTALSEWLFDTSGLTPHGFCLVWDPALIWTYALSDTFIALAYFSIPVTLLYVARRRPDLVYRPVLWLFAAFILLCGTTHWLDVALLWNPLYGLQAVVKAATAVVSVVTAVALWFLMPRWLALPSPRQMQLANDALLASREQLAQAQKMEAVGQLTGGVAHDFNNLLQVITGSLTLLEKRIAQGRVAETERYLSAMRQACDTAARLTSRLLTFSRRQTLQPRPVELDHLVGGMAELLNRTLGPEVTLEVKLGDGVWRAFCDPSELESALLNLAINARDAMPEGGRLLIATADRTLTPEELAGEEIEPGRYIEIKVSDTGSGMTPEVLSRVFDPFFTTKPAGQGTGLGMSQVYGFSRQSGGMVRVESAPGEGTTVRLFLPGYGDGPPPPPRPEQTLAAAEATPPLAGPERTILVVEDEPQVRGQIVDTLEDASCRVLEAADGPAALEVLRTDTAIDLLVSDVGMPGMNGRQLVEAARAIRPGLPVLLVTGYAGAALEGAEDWGGLDVLRKPFGLEELRERVKGLLAKA